MNSFEKVVSIFEAITEETNNNNVAAAILTFTTIFDEHIKDIDHFLSLGIRHGLFGKDAEENVTITDIAYALYEIADQNGKKLGISKM